jgi:predicted enzyme related to lactoylglutathione lyase
MDRGSREEEDMKRKEGSSMKPNFEPGENIAIKVSPHQFEKTVAFYRDVLGLEQIHMKSPDQYQSVTFEFGGKQLWIDKISSMSQAEIWLEIKTDNLEQASHYFNEHEVVRSDEIDPLPSEFRGFWISSPANIIHLIHDVSTQ